MSYSIEYNRQFIRTSSGYIPVVLMGDNNVYDGNRRARSWCVPFKGLFNKTEEKMLEHMKGYFTEYDQHWKRGGSWISNAGLLAWVRSGCASACSLEDFLVVNPFGSFKLALVLYDKSYNSTEVLRKYLKTTDDLDNWCQEAEEYLNQNYSGSTAWYYSAEFSCEDIVHPPIGEGVFALKRSPDFFYASATESVADPKKALLLTADEWIEHIRQNPLYSYRKHTPHFIKVNNTDVFTGNEGYILCVDSGKHAGRYVKCAVKRHCHMCINKNDARRYATEASAKAAQKNIESKYSALAGCLKIEKIGKEKEEKE